MGELKFKEKVKEFYSPQEFHFSFLGIFVWRQN